MTIPICTSNNTLSPSDLFGLVLEIQFKAATFLLFSRAIWEQKFYLPSAISQILFLFLIQFVSRSKALLDSFSSSRVDFSVQFDQLLFFSCVVNYNHQ